MGRKQEVVVYDQSSKEAVHLSKDGFVHILMGKLEGTFHKVSLLTGMRECVAHECDDGGVVFFFFFFTAKDTSIYISCCFSPYYTLPIVQRAGVPHLTPPCLSEVVCNFTVWSPDVTDEHHSHIMLVVPHFLTVSNQTFAGSQVYVEIERRGGSIKAYCLDRKPV